MLAVHAFSSTGNRHTQPNCTSGLLKALLLVRRVGEDSGGVQGSCGEKKGSPVTQAKLLVLMGWRCYKIKHSRREKSSLCLSTALITLKCNKTIKSIL